MKTIGLSVLMSVFFLSGLAPASRSGDQKESPSMPMRQGDKDGQHMGGIMRMMKMMDQCAAMMESAQADSRDGKESQKQ
ncbi:MAG: hypothetical protein ACREQ7_07865 [Candidatus Binatia bacterium]